MVTACIGAAILSGCGTMENDVETVRDEQTKESTSEVQKSSENENTIIEVSSKNLCPVVYKQDGIEVSVEKCEYTKGKEFVRLDLYVQNKTNSVINVGFENVHINDVNLTMGIGNGEENIEEIEPDSDGAGWSICYYISADQLKRGGVSDFDKLNCTFVIRDANGADLFNKDAVFMRDAFVEYED